MSGQDSEPRDNKAEDEKRLADIRRDYPPPGAKSALHTVKADIHCLLRLLDSARSDTSSLRDLCGEAADSVERKHDPVECQSCYDGPRPCPTEVLIEQLKKAKSGA